MPQRLAKLCTVLVLVLATTHCVMSIFFVNQSYFDLHQYAHGEVLPVVFQRRFLMVPILRAAERSHLLQAVATRYGTHVAQPEPMTAMKLACILLSIVMMNVMGLYSLRFARRFGLRQEWLIWALFIGVLYASYGARYEQTWWYPYDMPNIFLFGLATMFLLEDLPWAFGAAMAVDVFVRESSLMLLLAAFFMRIKDWRWRIATGIPCVLWLVDRWLGAKLYPGPAWTYSRLVMLRYLLPQHWPQDLSIVGFLWIPVWLGRRYLSQDGRRLLAAATVLMILISWWAIPVETRVWAEWSMCFAILAAFEIEGFYGARSVVSGEFGKKL